MTVSSAFPSVSSDSFFASESLSDASQQNYRRILEKLSDPPLKKLVALSKQVAQLLPALALCVALCGMACASIFILVAEQELSPIATAFNRLLIATIAFALWNTLPTLMTPHEMILPTEISLTQKDGTGARFGSLAIFPVLCWSQHPIFPTSWTSGLTVLGLALISQVIGHRLLTYSLKQFSSGLRFCVNAGYSHAGNGTGNDLICSTVESSQWHGFSDRIKRNLSRNFSP